jgi:hypothetical protein
MEKIFTNQLQVYAIILYMETFMKADIFFFVTTIAVGIITIFLCVAIYYVIVGLRRFKDLADKLERGIDTAEENISETVERVTDSFLFGLLFPKKRKKKKGKTAV